MFTWLSGVVAYAGSGNRKRTYWEIHWMLPLINNGIMNEQWSAGDERKSAKVAESIK